MMTLTFLIDMATSLKLYVESNLGLFIVFKRKLGQYHEYYPRENLGTQQNLQRRGVLQ